MTSIIDDYAAINARMPRDKTKDKSMAGKWPPEHHLTPAESDVCYPPDDDRHYDRAKPQAVIDLSFGVEAARAAFRKAFGPNPLG